MSDADNGFNENIEKYLNKIIDEDREIGISEVYTELSAKEILPITLKFRNEKSDRIHEFEVLELVEKEDKLIISGESGSGKTTTLKWLNFTFATEYLEKKEGSIPLYIELNSYIKDPFYDYFKKQIKKKGLSEVTLKTVLEGNSIILLDGLDLLSSTDKFFPYDEISNFISEYSNCRFVVSSRPGFFESIRRDFKISELEKLTDEKSQQFIDKYVTDKKIGDIIKNEIFNDEKLKSLLTNPMLLYLALKVAAERKDDAEDLLTSNRSTMYEAFVSGLFFHYEKRKGRTLCADRKQIKNALTDLYFKLQCWNRVSCEYSEALEIISKHTEDPKFEKTTTKCILGDCLKIGLLVRKDLEIEDTKIEYGIHQSFQEYFAAIKLKELFEDGYDISEAFSHPKWEEVVIFTSEILDSIDELIDLMLSKGELLLASKCANKASDGTKEKLCSLLANKIDSIYVLEQSKSIESLGKMGTFGISIIADVLKDKNKDRSVRISAIKALENIKSEKAILSLIDALKDNGLQSDAATSLKNIKSKKVVQLLIDALKDKDVRSIVIETLGDIKSEIAAQPLIDALKDEDWSVRWHAADALGKIKLRATTPT